jgi:hypothetical protein|tara:strand:- start:19490 stop:19672 length:183 start_codon:yes stop_codon:yes gene_type:complete
MEFFTNNWTEILSAVTSIVGGFAIIATLTPNQADNKIIDAVMQLINTLGGNFGNAKNRNF